jgi:hypothetical protein
MLCGMIRMPITCTHVQRPRLLKAQVHNAGQQQQQPYLHQRTVKVDVLEHDQDADKRHWSPHNDQDADKRHWSPHNDQDADKRHWSPHNDQEADKRHWSPHNRIN